MNTPLTPTEFYGVLLIGALLVFALVFIIIRALGGHSEDWRTREEVIDTFLPYLKKEEDKHE